VLCLLVGRKPVFYVVMRHGLSGELGGTRGLLTLLLAHILRIARLALHHYLGSQVAFCVEVTLFDILDIDLW